MAMLFLTAPAAAWTARQLAHANPAVAAGAYHYHEIGGVVVPHHKPGDPAEHDGEGDGHDHFLSLSLAVDAILSSSSLAHPPVSTPVPADTEVQTLPPGTAEPPPLRPPSFA